MFSQDFRKPPVYLGFHPFADYTDAFNRAHQRFYLKRIVAVTRLCKPNQQLFKYIKTSRSNIFVELAWRSLQFNRGLIWSVKKCGSHTPILNFDSKRGVRNFIEIKQY